MMYARYVPPKAVAQSKTTDLPPKEQRMHDSGPSKKRKRQDKHDETHKANVSASFYARYVPEKASSAIRGASKSSESAYFSSAPDDYKQEQPPQQENGVGAPKAHSSNLGTTTNGNEGFDARDVQSQSHKKRKNLIRTHGGEQQPSEAVDTNGHVKSKKRKKHGEGTREGYSELPRSTGVNGKSKKVLLGPRIVRDEDNDTAKEPQKPKRKSRQTDSADTEASLDREPVEAQDHRERSKSHTAVLSRYAKSARPPKLNEDKVQTALPVEDEKPEINELVPIPLPPSEVEVNVAPFVALPSWLSKPVSVAASSETSFKELKIDPHLEKNLHQKGYSHALAVQTGVLPLLLPTIAQHPGDLCVSAATGSGKTLSYVLPIVQDIQVSVANKLRAIIVVPTRELVSQVRVTCEMCANGTNLRIGTAVGNLALKEEQELLVRRGMRYDPIAYQPVRERLDRKVGDEPPDNSDDEEDLGPDFNHDDDFDTLTDHVPIYTSKVDILISTPGRLVEHIRSTRGFSLEDLQWLVIDEADRLLDQSFQDWADVLNEAIEAKTSIKPFNPLAGGPLLSGIFAYHRRPSPRKVILSATMTSDLSKLSALNLRNPKMVLVEGVERSTTSEAGSKEPQSIAGTLVLPPNLEETGVPVGDGRDKPLYLFALLKRIMGKAFTKTAKARLQQPDDADSESDAASDVSSSDTSSYVSSSAPSARESSPSMSQSRDLQSSSFADNEAMDSTTASDPPITPTPTSTSQPSSRRHAFPTILIFTSSNESTARLHHVLTFLAPNLNGTTSTLTKTTTTQQTSRLLHRLRTGALRILIASDRASRGLDFPALTDVVSYDIPRSVTDYVHRVGRTARAGGSGRAWTLLQGGEPGWFWHDIAGIGTCEDGSRKRRGEPKVRILRGDGRKVKKVRLDGVGEDGMKERFAEALERLKDDVREW